MIEQKEQSVTEQLVPQSATMFTKTEQGKRSSRLWSEGELPYPFHGLEEVVSKSSSLNLALVIDNVVYQLQSVSFAPMPNLRVH